MAFSGFNIQILKSTTALDAQTGMLHVGYIRWINGAAADDECEVTDTAGNVLFNSIADGANFIDLHPLFKWVNGVIISTLDSGTVFIYLV